MVSTLIFIIFCLCLSVGLQARLDVPVHQRLKFNWAQAVSFPSASTDVGDVAVINGNEHIVQPMNFFDLANQSLRFTPNDQNGYDASLTEEEFAEAFGKILELDDDDSEKVSLGFSFPFFGEEYTEVFVNSDGNLTFDKGDASHKARDLQRFLGEAPRIGVLYQDLNPFSWDCSVEVKPSPGKITITWFNVPTWTDRTTMQVVLSETGIIDIVFEESEVRTGIVGIAPGGIDDAFEVTLVDYSDDLPLEGATGAIAEVFVEVPTVNLQNLAREFYRTHGDDFDSLILFTNFESDLDEIALAFAIPVKNDVLGIGNPSYYELFPLFDKTADYGSQGTLKAILSMNNLKLWEGDPLESVWGPATSTLSVLAHEFEHIWGIYIEPFELVGRDWVHWNFFLHTAGSVMGGNDIQDNGDGTFTTLEPKDIYSPLDLYLMGLLKPDEIPPTFLVTEVYDLDLPPPYDEEFISADALAASDPMGDVTFRGEKKEITIEEIMTTNGVRVPDAESSQKDFRVAFILLAMGEEDPTPDEIEKVETARLYWPPYFHRAVNNLATMVSTLDGSPEDVELPEEIPLGEFAFTLALNRGLNIISLPLRPQEPFTARSLMEFVNSTIIIGASNEGKFTPFGMETPGDGFPIEGGRGYIVNTLDGGPVTFTGTPWADTPQTGAGESTMAPPFNPSLWAFVVDGVLERERYPGPYQITVQNLRTGDRIADLSSASGRFTLAFVDLSRKPVVQMGDVLRLIISDATSDELVGKTDRVITLDNIRKAYLTINLEFIDLAPMTTKLLQNYPNPFNPDTWLPYQLADDADVTIRVYNTKGQLTRTIGLGHKPAGFYMVKQRAAHWDGRDESGEKVASGIYFYSIEAGDFAATKKMVIAQ
jgi:hypothetical protein